MKSSEIETSVLSARLFTRLSVFALSAIALLVICGQLVIQRALFKVNGDASLTNIAGRQRMFSQRISKDVLRLASPISPEVSKLYAQELEKSLRQFVSE